MLDELVTRWLRWWGGDPCFRIYGKARRESHWRLIDVYATHRRDRGSRIPLWDGTCTTWSSRIISVGWDFAESILREQRENPACRDHPVEVAGGRLRHPTRRAAVGAPSIAFASEVLAHECGHTWQALRLDLFYLPLVGSVTLFREGPYPWNHFENEASEQGQFGGIVNGSVSDKLMARLGEE
jgi:hypothetical protein